MDETVVVSRNDTTSSTTQGVTSPTTTPTTTTVDTIYNPTVTPTTYTPTYTPVTTVDNTYNTNVPATTATTTDDDFGIDPSSFAPSPVAASTTTGTYPTDSNTVYTTSPYAAGTTYPTVSGYGSNPDFDFVQPTTSAQWLFMAQVNSHKFKHKQIWYVVITSYFYHFFFSLLSNVNYTNLINNLTIKLNRLKNYKNTVTKIICFLRSNHLRFSLNHQYS